MRKVVNEVTGLTEGIISATVKTVSNTVKQANNDNKTPYRLCTAKITYPDPYQTILSIHVPTIGACGLIRGTACLIMFEPISALVASSCSKNGISEVSTDMVCFGEISICVISLTYAIVGSLEALAERRVAVKFPNASTGVFASAIVNFLS